MLLSEAIRLGGATTKQCTGRLGTVVQGELHTCAMGSAMYAVGELLADGQIPNDYIHGVDEFLYRHWPEEASVTVECPECRGWGTMVGVILHLNDLHRWTRERIADYVATREGGRAEGHYEKATKEIWTSSSNEGAKQEVHDEALASV
jgi:hypothetical protein